MYLEETGERANLTPDGVNQLAKRTRDPEKREFLNFLENEWRKLEYEEWFTDVVNWNRLWNEYGRRIEHAKELLMNFREGLRDPQGGMLTREKLRSMIEKWDLFERKSRK